jgi:hypothetical protein
MISMGNALTAVIILDGKAVGSWKRVLKENSVEIKLSPFKKLNEGKLRFIKKAAENYGKFLKKKRKYSFLTWNYF